MKRFIIFLLLFVGMSINVQAYPNNELGVILNEQYPNATINRYILLQDDGNGVYVKYNASDYPIPDNATLDAIWVIVQNKRNALLNNETVANRIKSNYSQSMNDLYTIQNVANPTEAQQNWAIKREAAILQDVLRFLKWVFWRDE